MIELNDRNKNAVKNKLMKIFLKIIYIRLD